MNLHNLGGSLASADQTKRSMIYFCLQFLYNEILPQVVLVEQSDKIQVLMSIMISMVFTWPLHLSSTGPNHS